MFSYVNLEEDLGLRSHDNLRRRPEEEECSSDFRLVSAWQVNVNVRATSDLKLKVYDAFTYVMS